MTAFKPITTEVRWYFYREATGEWRWDAVAPDGTIVARSPTAFASRAQSVRDAMRHGRGRAAVCCA